MYCDVAANRPYARHLPKMLCGTTFDFDVDPPLSEDACHWIRRNHNTVSWCDTLDAAAALEQTKTLFASRLFGHQIRGAVVRKTAFQIQPYPNRDVVPMQSAVSLIWGKDKAIGLDIKVIRNKHGETFVLTPRGLENPTYEFGHFPDFTGDWQPLPTTRIDGRDYFSTEHRLCFPAIWVRDRNLGDQPVLMTCGRFVLESIPGQ